MKQINLSLEDICPAETNFHLDNFPNHVFTLSKWNLKVRSWAMKKYGPAELAQIFEKQKIEQIVDIAFFMLKDKSLLTNLDVFMENVCSPKDHLSIIVALLGAVGIGEAKLEEIKKAMGAAPMQSPVKQSPSKNKKLKKK